jgi:hypothetical protein
MHGNINLGPGSPANPILTYAEPISIIIGVPGKGSAIFVSLVFYGFSI